MRHVAFAVTLLAGVAPTAYAQIVAAPGSGAHVIQTQNGLPQVNIAKPSGAGVSMNTYSQFDVQKQGAILNNSAAIVQTQQAGFVNGNPNLAAGQSAKIIVNQVNSNSPSQLRGYVEVAGSRAEVVIANASGLIVDGAGFINTSRGILTTGSPVFGANGALTGFDVRGGQISVQGAGMNASNVDQVDLIARAVQANAAIYGNTLNVITGSNHVDHDTLAATPISGEGAAPAFSIDVGQLGGMYANRIFLASNEFGVGVSNAGVLAAQAGDLTLAANGRLSLTGKTTASGNLAINAHDGIDNSGTTYAEQSVKVDTAADLQNTGTLAAQQSTNINAGSVASSGTLGAGINSDGSIAGAGDLTITTSGALKTTGNNTAGGNTSLSGAAVDLSGSRTSAIQAGSGGFDINVKGNTDLKGGYIASDADASKNTLTTGTLTYSDVHNHSDYDSSTSGFTAGTQGFLPMMGQSDSGHSSATTKSGVGAGTVTITNAAGQTQDVSSLNRDTSNLNGTVAKTPDVNTVLGNQLDVMNAANAAGQAVAKDIGTYADVREHAAKDGEKAASLLGEKGDAATYQQEANDWGEGGEYRVGLHIVGGAVLGGLGGGSAMGAIGGAVGAGVSAALAPTLNDISRSIADSGPTGNATVDKILGQVVANGVAGVAGGAVGGSAGAFTASNGDMYNRQLHPDEATKLAALKDGKTPEEQQRLNDAECALVHCGDGVPDNDPHKLQLMDSQTRGQQYTVEKNEIITAGAFDEYTWKDAFNDGLLNHDEAIGRTLGAAGAVSGALGMASGGAIAAAGVPACTTVAGCALIPVGLGIAALGYDQSKQGAINAFGPYSSTQGQRVINSFDPRTYPGDQDRAAELGIDAAKNAAMIGLGWLVGGGTVSRGSVTGAPKLAVPNADNPEFVLPTSDNPTGAGLKNGSGDLNAAGNSARNQPYGNGVSASPSPGTGAAGSTGGNASLPATSTAETSEGAGYATRNSGGNGNAQGSSGGASISNTSDLQNAANQPINDSGLSVAARAWDKHAGRPGGTFEPLTGSIADKNAAASQFVNQVLSDPSTTRTNLSRGGVEFRLPSGQGIRFDADGSFSTFLDPRK